MIKDIFDYNTKEKGLNNVGWDNVEIKITE